MDGRDVAEALDEMVRVLAPHAEAGWERRAGSLEWSCRATAAHVAHDLLAYAGQVAARPTGAYLPYDLTVRPDAGAADVLAVVTAAGRLLCLALDAAAPETRAWHWGPTDPGGFAALGVNEILVHTHDIAEGLGIPWRPPADLCAAVLDRLFPGSPGGDPAEVLLWATGRTALPGHPRRASWTLKAAVGAVG